MTESGCGPNLLDVSLVTYFPGPHSYSGEDTLEIYAHGGPAVIDGLLRSIGKLNSQEANIQIRYAEAGEFSKRAFLNGKFDLTEAEGINNLIDAETESERRGALSSFNGENRALFESWRNSLLNDIAQLTAIIDFGEDNDLDAENERIYCNVEDHVRTLKREMEDFKNQIERAKILQNGIKLSLIGEPNVGKSSLLNCMGKRDIAIVSNIPGTTRDTVDTVMDIQGYKVILSDTAGIRDETNDSIEMIGIGRAKLKAQNSDICLLVLDVTRKYDPKEFVTNKEIQKLLNSRRKDKPVLIVLNKTDLVDDSKLDEIKQLVDDCFHNEYPIFAISCKTTKGITSLTNQLVASFKSLSSTSDSSDAIIVSQRVNDILVNDVLYGINKFLNSRSSGADLVMATEDLQCAVNGIGKISGDFVGVEEILGVVFSKFCVGK